MTLYITPNNELHDDADGYALTLPSWPKNARVATQDEIEEIINIPKTPEQLKENVRVELQSAIDEKAKSFGFSGGNSLMLYAGFVNPYQSLAQVFATWEASVWVEADAYKAEVIAGTKPMLTGAEAVALMPTYPA